MQAPRLVATDVDGTLLDPADRVTPRATAVIDRLIAAGVEFVLVTGRWDKDIGKPPFNEYHVYTFAKDGTYTYKWETDQTTPAVTGMWELAAGKDGKVRLRLSAKDVPKRRCSSLANNPATTKTSSANHSSAPQENYSIVASLKPASIENKPT